MNESDKSDRYCDEPIRSLRGELIADRTIFTPDTSTDETVRYEEPAYSLYSMSQNVYEASNISDKPASLPSTYIRDAIIIGTVVAAMGFAMFRDRNETASEMIYNAAQHNTSTTVISQETLYPKQQIVPVQVNPPEQILYIMTPESGK